MRTLSDAMQTHLAGRSHSRAWMVRLDLRDGTVIGLTSWDQDIEFDLGDAAGLVTYQARTGARVSDVELVEGLEPSNFELRGPIGEAVSLEAVLGGRFNRAEVRLFQVNTRNLGAGAIELLLGNVTDAKPEAGQFIFEVRGQADRLNQTVGRVLSPMCDADFGDARCGLTPESIAATVSAPLDDLQFSVLFAGSYADAYFNFGKVEFLTGELAGTKMEILEWTAAGLVTVFAQLAEVPAIGDTCTISRGCSKARRSDDPNVPTCMTYNNVINFRGFPDMTGTDQILRPTIPGQGNEA